MDVKIKENLKVLWNYLYVNDEIEKVDCIFGLGSIDKSVAEKCAKLYLEGYGDYIVFSGNCGKGTEGIINITEAEWFSKIAIELGVPKDKIYLENEATNTYENFWNTKKVIEKNNLKCDSLITVSKPYATRRVFQIAKIQIPNKKVIISSSEKSMDEFFEFCRKMGNAPEEDVINEVVGEISILQKAPKYNLQTSQKIPENVIQSYDCLLGMGFNRYVITDESIRKAIEKYSKKDK